MSAGFLTTTPAHATEQIAPATNVQVSTTQSSVYVSWTPPSNASAAGLHHYGVTFYDAQGAQVPGWPATLPASQTSRTFSASEMAYYGIAAGGSYQVRVTSLGTDTMSDSAFKPFTIIAPTTNVQVSSSQTSVDVSWTPPSNASVAGLHHYYVFFYDAQGNQLPGWHTSVAGSQTQRSFTESEMAYYGMTPGNSYQVRITALGTATMSDSAFKPFTIVAPATNVQVSSTQTSVDVSWTAPSNASAAGVHHYYVTFFDAQGAQLPGWPVSLPASQKWRSFNESEMAYYGITPGNSYQVRITSAGANTISDSAFKSFSVIAPATNVQVSTTQTSVDVSWTAPSNASAAGLHHYYVTFFDAQGAQLPGWPVSLLPSQTSRTFNASEMAYYGITPGNSYQVRITSAGSGTMSDSAFKPFTV